MQVETIYTFKNYLYIVTSGFFSQNKVNNNYSIRACWIWDDYGQLSAMHLTGYLSSHIQRALVELLLIISYKTQ